MINLQKYLWISLLLFILIGLIGYSYGASNLQELISFSKNEGVGYASINNIDNSILVTAFIDTGTGSLKHELRLFKNNTCIKKIPDARNGVFSSDGKYYAYYNEVGKKLYICNQNNKQIQIVPISGILESFVWTFDSKSLFVCEEGDNYIIYKIERKTGSKTSIINSKSIYSHPITTKNDNILYLLQDKNSQGSEADCIIVKYNLRNKQIEPVTINNVDNYSIFDNFTISPDETTAVFCNIEDFSIYFVDLRNQNIIEKISLAKYSYPHPTMYSWKSDSSCLLFTITSKEVYKYTIPTATSLSVGQGNPLSPKYAKYYHLYPGGKELSEKEQQEQIAEANSLSDEGFNYYQAKKDDLAIAKYEEALTHYASAEIYYRYGNSLSNIPRLEDAVKAYQIALELNYDKPGLVYYNFACVYSRMNHSKEAFANLELAINNGYKNFDQKDEDLAWLRSQPEWKEWWGKHQQ